MRGYAVRLTMIGIFVLHSMVCFTVPAFAQAVPEITAEAAVMLDMDTGEVLYGKAEHERRPPASLTKVMTGYLAAQRQDLMHQEVVISELAAATGESSLTSAGSPIQQNPPSPLEENVRRFPSPP